MSRARRVEFRDGLARWVRYAALATAVTLCLTAVVWVATAPETRSGVLLAGAIALPLQLLVFAAMVVPRKGSPAFLGMWVGGTFVRLLAVGGVAWLATAREAVHAGVTLLSLVGLLFVLLLLEPWMLRETSRDRIQRTER
ncbi:MAG: hypothetical protein WD960_10850 [Gemmatimonadota bacterium]